VDTVSDGTTPVEQPPRRSFVGPNSHSCGWAVADQPRTAARARRRTTRPRAI
jgi:hypothetical protein